MFGPKFPRVRLVKARLISFFNDSSRRYLSIIPKETSKMNRLNSLGSSAVSCSSSKFHAPIPSPPGSPRRLITKSVTAARRVVRLEWVSFVSALERGFKVESSARKVDAAAISQFRVAYRRGSLADSPDAPVARFWTPNRARRSDRFLGGCASVREGKV